ncbi:chromate efflux transporter [Amylibacter sp. IMCC11727]|uniref:chromate efflux transporter n=1 Tax=Amylibacter sp. IMCC11727 TaxID=3039851 RepID=UPI00244E0D5D|nr:chromate efflux transporter [Amylibacter sp. IMCC11727]WGI21403.1 chromate efflux transporter [Amylibacter sp. IMCC11727]
MSQPTLTDATKVWAKIGFLSFGGPAGQIALMHKEVVETRKWMSERHFLNALSFCMLLPGPEAMQLATFAGWRLHGTLGGLIAGLLFVLPGAFVILALAFLYITFGQLPAAEAIFLGIKATVVIIVIEALLRVSKKALHSMAHWLLAATAFVAIFFLNLPFPLIILAAGVFGLLTSSPPEDVETLSKGQPIGKTIRTILLWLAIWWLPILVLDAMLPASILTEIAYFFSKLATVTFGGAYAVLAYMGQDVVTAKDWLTTGQMMDGLGLAETTPGPLILVTEFVGILAGYANGGWGTALLAAGITLWVTFTPCFLWIFAGAPYVEWISAQPRLRGALNAITAAVVGVILNLSVWFALHVFFGEVTQTKAGIATLWVPTFSSLNPIVVALAIVAGVLLLVRHMNLLWVLAISGTLGFASSLV